MIHNVRKVEESLLILVFHACLTLKRVLIKCANNKVIIIIRIFGISSGFIVKRVIQECFFQTAYEC